MRNTIKRVLLVHWLAYGVLPLLAQSPPQIDVRSQPAVAALRALAHTIKECPRALRSEKKWGKGPAEIERWYVGPPQNIVWDVVPSSSVRSPYVGYIEFSLPEDYWVPDEVKDQFLRSEASSSAELARAQGHINGPMKYRYEFDLGPNGVELTRMLRGRNPAERVDDSPDETCWQKAARDVQTAPADLATASIISVSFVNVAGNVFLLRCDTEDKIAKEACKLWLGGFYNGLAAAGVMVVATPKEAAKNNAVCFPQTPTDEQLFYLILKYIKDHPRDADQPTAALALTALQEAFPCKH